MANKRAGASLERYRAKRDFARTPEPQGAKEVGEERLFVVQKHAARRLHYDLRLQFGDSLRSWAVPNGPSLDPKVRRLAVRVDRGQATLEAQARGLVIQSSAMRPRPGDPGSPRSDRPSARSCKLRWRISQRLTCM